MFRIINKYQTGDGEIHDTLAKAAEHVEIQICDAIQKAIWSAKRPNVTSVDVHFLTIAIYENRAEIFKALKLDEFGDDGKSDDEEN